MRSILLAIAAAVAVLSCVQAPAFAQAIPVGGKGQVPLCTLVSLHAGTCQQSVGGYLATISNGGDTPGPNRCANGATTGETEVRCKYRTGVGWQEDEPSAVTGLANPLVSDLDAAGNDITNPGTVDGRDVAADGAKLDIIAGALFYALEYATGSSTHGLAEAVTACEAAGGGTVITHSDGTRTINGATATAIPLLTKCSIRGAGFRHPVQGETTTLTGPSVYFVTNAAGVTFLDAWKTGVKFQDFAVRMSGTDIASRCVVVGNQATPSAEIDFINFGCENHDGTGSEGAPGIGIELDDWLKSSIERSYVEGWDRGISIGGTSASNTINANSIRANDVHVWLEADLVGREIRMEGNALESHIDVGIYFEAGSQIDLIQANEHMEAVQTGGTAIDVDIASIGARWQAKDVYLSDGLTVGARRTATFAGRGPDTFVGGRIMSSMNWSSDRLVLRHVRSIDVAGGVTLSGGIFDESRFTDTGTLNGCADEFATRDSYGLGAECLDPSTQLTWVCTQPNAVTANGVCDDAAEVSAVSSVFQAAAFPGADIGAKVNAAFAAMKEANLKGGVIDLPGGTLTQTTAIDVCEEGTGNFTGVLLRGQGRGVNGNKGGTILSAAAGFASTNVARTNYTIGQNDGPGGRDRIACVGCQFVTLGGIKRGDLIETTGFADNNNNYHRAQSSSTRQFPLTVYRVTETEIVVEMENSINAGLVAAEAVTAGEVRRLKAQIETCTTAQDVTGMQIDGNQFADIGIHHRPDNAPVAGCTAAGVPYAGCSGVGTGSVSINNSVGNSVENILAREHTYYDIALTATETGVGQSDHYVIRDSHLGAESVGGFWYDSLQAQPGPLVHNTQIEAFKRFGAMNSSGSMTLNNSTVISQHADCLADTYGPSSHVEMRSTNTVGLHIFRSNIETKCGAGVRIGSGTGQIRALTLIGNFISSNAPSESTAVALLDAPAFCGNIVNESTWVGQQGPGTPTLTIGNSNHPTCPTVINGRGSYRNSGLAVPTLTVNNGIPSTMFDQDLLASINSGEPNGTGASVHWSELTGVPAGFADGTDDGTGGGYATIEDETTPLTQRTTLGFAGAGVTCADSGGETVCTIPGGGSVATDPIWDAAGDLAIGVGADSATKLAKGSAGQALIMESSGTIPLWEANPGGGQAGLIVAVTDKATPVVGDHLLIEDSAASNAKRDITIGSLETALEGVIDLPDLQGTLTVAKGGTGVGTLTDGGILIGNGTGSLVALGVASNGQIPIGDGTTDPVLGTLTGTTNEIAITNGAGSITVGIPDSPVFVTPDIGAATGTSLTLSDPGDNLRRFSNQVNSASLGTPPASNCSIGFVGASVAAGVPYFHCNGGSLTSLVGGGGLMSADIDTSAELDAIVSDSTGSGALVFATSPTLVTPALGTPASGDATNLTNIPAAQVTGSIDLGTGTIRGAVSIESTSSTTHSLTSFEGQWLIADESGSTTINLANITAAGQNFCVYASTAQTIIVNPDDSDTITYEATTDTAGHQISGPATTIGAFACFLATSTTNWAVLGRSGTWVPGS